MNGNADVGVDETLSLEHTIGHVLDPSLRTGAVLETDRVSHLLTKTAPDLLSDTLSHGHSRNTPWLRAANLALVCESRFGKVLSHLRRFARASITDDNQHLVLRGTSTTVYMMEDG